MKHIKYLILCLCLFTLKVKADPEIPEELNRSQRISLLQSPESDDIDAISIGSFDSLEPENHSGRDTPAPWTGKYLDRGDLSLTFCETLFRPIGVLVDPTGALSITPLLSNEDRDNST